MPLDDREELFIVVDKDDKILGTATRKECHSNRNLIHRGIYVVVSDSAGRILLQKRSMKKDLGPGIWDVSCGGHCAPGESYEQAAKRELKEELGLSLKLKRVGKLLIRRKVESEYDMVFSAAIRKEKIRFDMDEIDSVKFFSEKEIKAIVKDAVAESFPCVMSFYMHSRK